MKHDSTRWIVFGGFLLVAFTIVVILIDARNEQYYNLKQKFQDLLEKTFPKGVDLVYLWTHPSSTKYFLELLRWYQNELIGRKELLENITIIHRVSDYFRFFVRSVRKECKSFIHSESHSFTLLFFFDNSQMPPLTPPTLSLSLQVQ